MDKIATDLNQGQKLSKILPIESADMSWVSIYDENHLMSDYRPDYRLYLIPYRSNSWESVPAWSLSALINVLPDTIEDDTGVLFGLNIKKNFVEYYNPSMGALYATYHSVNADDLIDACVEMILKLKEKGLL